MHVDLLKMLQKQFCKLVNVKLIDTSESPRIEKLRQNDLQTHYELGSLVLIKQRELPDAVDAS